VHPNPAGPVRRLDLGDRAAGGPLRPGVAEREQLLVSPVGADLPLAAFDPLLELREVLVDQLRTSRRSVAEAAGLTQLHVTGDGVVRAIRELGGVAVGPGQVVGIQNFHDLLGRLQLIPSSGAGDFKHRQAHPRKGLNRRNR
jgi:hypothetical protein